jgi:hypothetical protein
MPSKCVECDHLLVGDEVEYLYKGKSYCDDCLNSLLAGLALSRIPQHSQNNLSVKK